MLKIANTRALILYTINCLEEEKCPASNGRLMEICAEIQRQGVFVYTPPESPLSEYFRDYVKNDLHDCLGNYWVKEKEEALSITKSGKDYLRGAGLGLEIEEIIGGIINSKYKK